MSGTGLVLLVKTDAGKIFKYIGKRSWHLGQISGKRNGVLLPHSLFSSITRDRSESYFHQEERYVRRQSQNCRRKVESLVSESS